MSESFPYAVRDFGAALQVRETSDDGRTLFGRVVPYGEVVTVDDGQGPYRETFESGAFSRFLATNARKVKLYEQHNRSRLPIGVAVDWQDNDAGLDAEFRISSPKGDGALNLVRDEVVDSFSIGFKGIAAKKRGDVTVRTEAAIVEVSLVAEPAYSGAVVAGIRSVSTVDEFALWASDLTTEERAAYAALLSPLEGTDGHPDTTPAKGTGDQPNLRAVRFALLSL